MRCLDLFCGGGGAAAGYQAAGFEVVGVDCRNQARQYPGEFVLGDAVEYVRKHGSEFDLIHASPPCQGYSKHVKSEDSRWVETRGRREPRLIGVVREVLKESGRVWCMENVLGARQDLQGSLLLCGVMFGLPIRRHRLFELSHLVMAPEHPPCAGVAKRYAEERGWCWRDMTVSGKGRHAGTGEKWAEVMGVTHEMLPRQLAEAIPPAFTKFIGESLRGVIETNTRKIVA